MQFRPVSYAPECERSVKGNMRASDSLQTPDFDVGLLVTCTVILYAVHVTNLPSHRGMSSRCLSSQISQTIVLQARIRSFMLPTVVDRGVSATVSVVNPPKQDVTKETKLLWQFKLLKQNEKCCLRDPSSPWCEVWCLPHDHEACCLGLGVIQI